MSLTRNLLLKVLPLCAAIVAASAPAMAQDAPKAEVSVGYNYLHSSGDSMPKGWYADVTGNVTPALAVVGHQHRIAFPREPLAELLGHLRLVFHDQHAH